MSPSYQPGGDPLLGAMIQGRYRVLELIGEGGMGRVYLAEQLAIGRKVAIKFLHPQYAADESYVNRFRGEAQRAARVTDPRVVAIYEFGRSEDGSLFIVMEHVAGETLKDRIRRGPMPIDEAGRIALQLGEALRAAHQSGVIHRDVKPENVVLREGRDDVKLMDFGIARPATGGGTRHTRDGFIVGTPEYMAPEQVESGTASEQSDIYAWAIVLYEMLSGDVPFSAPTPAGVIVKQLQEHPIPVRKLRRDVPAALESLLSRCLEKRPERRPNSMDEVVTALAGAADRRGGSIRPTAVLERQAAPGSVPAGTGARVAIGTLLVLSVVLLAASAVLGYAWINEREVRAALEAAREGDGQKQADLSGEIAGSMGKIQQLSERVKELEKTIEAQAPDLDLVQNGRFAVCNDASQAAKVNWLSVTYRVSDGRLRKFDSAFYNYKTWSLPPGKTTTFAYEAANWKGEVVFYAMEVSYRGNTYLLSGPWADLDHDCVRLKF